MLIQLDLFVDEKPKIGSRWLSLTHNENVYITEFFDGAVLFQNKKNTFGGIRTLDAFQREFIKVKDR